VLEVLALRRDGFADEIRVSVEGLPSWVTCPGAVIGPGDTSAPLVFVASRDAPEWAGPIQVVGRARSGTEELTRRARPGSVVWPGVENTFAPRSRVARSLMLSVSSEIAPFTVEAGKDGVLETSRGGTVQVPVTLLRQGDFKGAIAIAATGLPPNVTAKGLSLDPNTSSGKLEINVQAGAPPASTRFGCTRRARSITAGIPRPRRRPLSARRSSIAR
jgi:hypothetical protein